MVMRQVAVLLAVVLAIGIAVGGLAAFSAALSIRSFLSEVPPGKPAVFATCRCSFPDPCKRRGIPRM